MSAPEGSDDYTLMELIARTEYIKSQLSGFKADEAIAAYDEAIRLVKKLYFERTGSALELPVAIRSRES